MRSLFYIFLDTVKESFPRMGADAPLRRSANPQRNFSEAMEDRLVQIGCGMVILGPVSRALHV